MNADAASSIFVGIGVRRLSVSPEERDKSVVRRIKGQATNNFSTGTHMAYTSRRYYCIYPLLLGRHTLHRQNMVL